MNSKVYDVVVIGAGPAGLLAAGRASAAGCRVVLLESMEKPARKLRISGKGRCNVTSTKPLDEFLEGIQPEPQFLCDAFGEFFSQDIVKLLNEQGVPTLEERGQRVFPASGKAWDVAEALVRWAKDEGVSILCNARATRIITSNGRTIGVEYIRAGREIVRVDCPAVVIATGGMSYPATGSTGDGYRLAAECGHTIATPLPTLVGIETHPRLIGAEGLTLRNVNLSLWVKGQKIGEQFGEVELTPYGLSGPIVLRMSRKIVALLHDGVEPELALDLKPALDADKLNSRLQREIEAQPRASVKELLRKLIPSQLIAPLAYQTALATQKPVSRLTPLERKTIALWLKNARYTVTGHRDWPEAIATAGGVRLQEIDPKTMESRLTKGLYLAGEVLDLDGATGGYNLQIAYSTGWLAGKSAGDATKRLMQ